MMRVTTFTPLIHLILLLKFKIDLKISMYLVKNQKQDIKNGIQK
ncbi:Uncharacterised protein [Providencia rettgeri]|nr:Uncharacterised protein [Providencia rettgeri]